MRVYTGGTFDIIHPGHVALLRQCWVLAEKHGHVTVALNTDDFVERYKGHRPVMSYDERADVLRSIRYVDSVVPNAGGEDSKPAIEAVRPRLIVVGADWERRGYLAQLGVTEAWLADRDITIHYARHAWSELISDTEIRRRIRTAP